MAYQKATEMIADSPHADVKKAFPIGYVALATGLSPHVIRVWERRYGAVAPEREGKKRRLYSQSDIDHLKLLKRACLRGCRIGSVAALDPDTLQRMDRSGVEAVVPNASSHERTAPLEILQALFRAGEAAVRDMDAPALLAALRRAEARLTRTALMAEGIAPLMHLIGAGGSSKDLGIVHEHFASNVVRSFLSDLLAHGTAAEPAPRMVVTTPAGQYCELGALTAGVAAADRGWRVFYFGADLPGEEIAAAAAAKKAEAVCLGVTCRPEGDTMRRELNRLRRRLGPEVGVLIGGRAAAACRGTVTASNFHWFESLHEFGEFISRPRTASLEKAHAGRDSAV